MIRRAADPHGGGGVHRQAAGDNPGRHRRRRAEAAIARARLAQVEWAHRPVAERLKIVERYRDLVIKNSDFLMDLCRPRPARPAGPPRRN